MAYELQLFGRSGEPVVQRAAPALLEAVSALDPDVVAIQVRDEVALAEYEVYGRDGNGARPGVSSARVPVINMTIKTAVRRDYLARFVERGGPAALEQCDTYIVLILFGLFSDVDWLSVRAICHAATQLWDAILHDETDGFDTSLAALDG
jgi:hypothetical protein